MNLFLPRWTWTLVLLILSTSIIHPYALPDRILESRHTHDSISSYRSPNLQAPPLLTSSKTGSPPPVTDLTHPQREEHHLEKRLQGGNPGWRLDINAPIILFIADTLDVLSQMPWRGFVLTNLLYPFSRGASIISSTHGVQTNFVTQNFKDMYTQIRNATLTQWAKLPEQSIIRVVYGQLVFIILPPADRTVPWSAVEEIAHWLLVLVVSGAELLMGGFYPFKVLTGVTWLYVAVVAPGTPPVTIVSQGEGNSRETYSIDQNGNVWVKTS